MKIAILTANLGNFDTPVDPVEQKYPTKTLWIGDKISEITFHRFNDENFPPIAGLTPRLQYRIPKLFGWEMFPGYDIYIWLDGTMSFTNPDSVKFFLTKLSDRDAAFFSHPQRKTVKEEVDHIEEKLKQKHKYMIPRYENGLHKEQLLEMANDPEWKDKFLYTSTAFIYRNNKRVRDMMKKWWYYQSRYYTCDQVSLPYAIFKSEAKVVPIYDNQYKIPYLTEVSKHK